MGAQFPHWFGKTPVILPYQKRILIMDYQSRYWITRFYIKNKKDLKIVIQSYQSTPKYTRNMTSHSQISGSLAVITFTFLAINFEMHQIASRFLEQPQLLKTLKTPQAQIPIKFFQHQSSCCVLQTWYFLALYDIRYKTQDFCHDWCWFFTILHVQYGFCFRLRKKVSSFISFMVNGGLINIFI